MLRRGARLAFILFQFILLNIVLPGHIRGAITVPGYKLSADQLAGSCCTNHSTDKTKKNAPTSQDRAHCAVCFFAARICTPPVIDCTIAEPSLCARLAPSPDPIAVSIHFPSPITAARRHRPQRTPDPS